MAFNDTYAQDLFINEVCASNQTVLFDQNGDSPDWLELYNPGPNEINLASYGLSDSNDSLMKWLFPEYILKPENYLLVFASGKDLLAPPEFWNSLITEGDLWNYKVPQSELSPDWKNLNFDDSDWLNGESGFGYGDGDDKTILATPLISVFLRKVIYIDDVDAIHELILSMDYDDAFVAYLNGTEIARENIGSVGTPPAYNESSTNYTEPLMISGGKPNNYDLEKYISLLNNGENLLAIQVHNHGTGSSDLTAIPFLSFSSEEKLLPEPIPLLDFHSSSFHTDFKLDKDGDSLYLSFPNGELIQLFSIENVLSDISLGYPMETPPEIKAFTEPTPWESNTSTPYNYNVFDDIIFSKESGFYQNSFNLTISSSTSEDSIYYSTDGTDPDINSFLYSEPINISSSHTIKALIIKQGFIPGKIYTNSYSIRGVSNISSVFLSTDPQNLFNNETGIYVMGDNASLDFPYFGANFWNDWERPAHIEYFSPEGISEFSLDAGIKIYGAYSRGHAMKSISVFARNEYGTKNIAYKLFDEKDINKFEAFVLRNSGNDWFGGNAEAGILFRDLLMTRVAGNSNIDYQAGRPVSLYINGEFWGIHNLREKINEHFISSNHSEIDPERINLLVGNKQIVQGSNADYVLLENFISANSLANQSNYEYAKTKMDIDNFIDYEVANIYYGNTDWPGNNIKFWKFDAEYSKWRWIMYDTDFGLGIWNPDRVYDDHLSFATDPNGPNWPNPPSSTFMLRNLLNNVEFKHQFINTFADRMNTIFLPESMNQELEEIKSQFYYEMQSHTQKWGGNFNTWLNNIENVKNFIEIRPPRMRIHILNYFNIENEYRFVTLNTVGCETASINISSLIIGDFPWSGSYFDKIPVKIRAITPDGYKFLRWEGSANSTNQEIVLDMTEAEDITAIYEPYVEEEFEGVIINEMSYNNPEGSKDWVEIFNNSSETRDLSGWILQDSDTSHLFKIENKTLLLPYSYYVISEDQESFFLSYPTIQNFTGNSLFAYEKTGECIYLYNSEKQLVNSVCFSSEYPWPESPLTTGHPIALTKPDSDNTLGYNWSATVSQGGTPGKSNSGAPSDIPLTESSNSGIILYQNFPNPFTSSTQIAFLLKTKEELSIQIYDLNGTLISQIANTNFQAGYHELEWDAENFSPGIYIIRLKSQNEIHQKRIILSK